MSTSNQIKSPSIYAMLPLIGKFQQIISLKEDFADIQGLLVNNALLLLLLLLILSRFSRVQLCATPWTAAHQASPSMGFSRQEHWSGLPFPSPMHESGK